MKPFIRYFIFVVSHYWSLRTHFLIIWLYILLLFKTLLIIDIILLSTYPSLLFDLLFWYPVRSIWIHLMLLWCDYHLWLRRLNVNLLLLLHLINIRLIIMIDLVRLLLLRLLLIHHLTYLTYLIVILNLLLMQATYIGLLDMNLLAL